MTRRIAYRLLAAIVVLPVIFMSAMCVDAAKGKINVLVVAGQEARLTEELTPAFEKKTGLTVNLDVVTYEQVRGKAVVEIMNRTGAYDVLFVDQPWLAEFAEAGYLLPLDDLIRKTGCDLSSFVEPYQKHTGVYKGTTYLLSYAPAAYIFQYRKDLFKAAGLGESAPATMDDWLSYAKKLTKDTNGDGRPDQYGVSTMGGRSGGTLVEWMHHLWALGADWFDEKTWIPAFADKGAAAIRSHLQLMAYAPPGVESAGYYEHITQFANGLAAMASGFSLWGPNWENPAVGGSKVAGRVGYSLLPRGPNGKPIPSMIAGWGLGIPVGAKDPELSLQYMAYLTSDEASMKYAALGGVPPRRAPFDSPELLAKWPYLKTHLDAASVAKPRLRLVEYAQVEEILIEELSMAYAGLKDPETAIKDAYKRTYQAMKDNGYYKK